jgi:hypothetical protein
MDPGFVRNNWALLVAAGLGAAIALVVVYHLIKRSAWGQLRRKLGVLAKARREEARAMRALDKAERLAGRLREKAERAKPRHLREATEALEDARALAKIAHDKVLVAENHVRRVIHEEYPPLRQAGLRARYLPETGRDKRPFSF